jgi:hypothetical protein
MCVARRPLKGGSSSFGRLNESSGGASLADGKRETNG